MRFGVLDQTPVRPGSTAVEALGESVRLAQHVEALGFDRYWLAEHHGGQALAGPAPEILTARIASATQTLRVGTGGVMLMHYSPFKVAEQFRVLEALFPGRIDLGIGRAPGADGHTSAALGYGNGVGPDYFAAKVADLHAWLTDTTPHTPALSTVRCGPSTPSAPELWLLGSTDQSAQLAAHLGLRFAFAHFIAPEQAAAILRLYRERFRPSPTLAAPYASLGVFVLCADTEREAQALARCRDLWRGRLARGEPGPWPTVAEAERVLGTDAPAGGQHAIAGTPAVVKQRLTQLLEETGVDHCSVITITPEHAQRELSYRRLAEAFSLKASAAA
jgi:luciferase family oxidoreductase group 1